jgi:hypothetical protein
MLTDVEAQFDGISVILANVGASPIVVSNLVAGSPRQIANFASNLDSQVAGTFGGAGSLSIPAGTKDNPTFVVSDMIPLSGATRSDGGVRPLVLLNMQFATTSDGATPLTYWSRSGPEWGTSPTFTDAGGRVLGTNVVPNAAAITSATVNPGGASPIVGFAYWARGKVAVVAAAGNSILAGSSLPANPSRSQLIKAVQAVSTPLRPIEYMVLGIPGSQTSTYCNLLIKLIGQAATSGGVFKPTHGVVHAFNTNSGPTLDTKVLWQPGTKLAATLENNKIAGCVVTGIPRQTGAVSYFTNDAVRRSFNESLPFPVIDAARITQSPTDPSLFGPGMGQSDGAHPTEAGDNAIVSQGYVPYLRSI